MTKTDYLLNLFRSHVADLNDVVVGTGDVFVCPICLREFCKEDIFTNNLTDGHIWPSQMRKKSSKANDLAVLLCKDCNNLAGSRGDAQMQLYEKIKEIPENGELDVIRTLEIIENPGDNPIHISARVNKVDASSFQLQWRLNKNNRWLGSNPKEQERFEYLIKRSLESQQQFCLHILPPREYKPNLVSAGWITCAYLMAFYTLGYRYILNEELNFIRRYIFSSFEPDQDKNMELQPSEDFHIYTDKTVDFPNPEVRITIPLKGNGKVHLEVCFLQYVVSLPILMEPNFYWGFRSYCLEHAPMQSFPPVNESESPCLYSYIHCTKTKEHTCVFDYLLGKPFSKSS